MHKRMRFSRAGQSLINAQGQSQVLKSDLACVGAASDVFDKHPRGNAAVVRAVVLLDVDGRVQDWHPALPILVQQRPEVLRAKLGSIQIIWECSIHAEK
jgi:hypothetical protein